MSLLRLRLFIGGSLFVGDCLVAWKLIAPCLSTYRYVEVLDRYFGNVSSSSGCGY